MFSLGHMELFKTSNSFNEVKPQLSSDGGCVALLISVGKS